MLYMTKVTHSWTSQAGSQCDEADDVVLGDFYMAQSSWNSTSLFPCKTYNQPKMAGSHTQKRSWHTDIQTKGVFIATQLNSTELSWTELTQLNSVQPVVFLFMTSWPTNWVTTFIDRWQLFTLWTCRQLDVELSCVGVAIDTSPTQLNSTRRRVVDTFTAWTTVIYQWT